MSKHYIKDQFVKFSITRNFLVNQQQVRREKNGELPKRITFLGHTQQRTFGDDMLKPVAFADLLIRYLDEACRLNPAVRASMKTIDLLSCTTGLVDRQGNSYAQTVADRLYAVGYTIQVNAFSNLALKKPFPAYMAWLSFLDDRTFETLVFRTKELYEKTTALLAAEKSAETCERKLTSLKSVTYEVTVHTQTPRRYLSQEASCHFIPEGLKQKTALNQLKKQISDIKKIGRALIQVRDNEDNRLGRLIVVAEFVLKTTEGSLLEKGLTNPEKLDKMLACLASWGVQTQSIQREGNTTVPFVEAVIAVLAQALQSLTAQAQALAALVEPREALRQAHWVTLFARAQPQSSVSGTDKPKPPKCLL